MRPEYVVAIAEMLTTCIGIVAVVNCSIALYKDLQWQKNVRTLPYFKDILGPLRTENSDQSALEMLQLIRDPFYQIVVLFFITPTIIHLTCHIIMTFAHHYDYDMSQVELDTPSEEPEDLLNLSGSAAALVTSLPSSRRDTVLLTVNSVASDPTTAMTMTGPANESVISKMSQRRHSVFLSMPPSKERQTESLETMTRSKVKISKKATIDEENSTANYSHHVSLQVPKNGVTSGVENIHDFQTDPANNIEEHQGEGQGQIEEGVEVCVNGGENNNNCSYPQQQQQSFPPFDEIDTLPFFNPRMCKLLLLATILLESLTGFSAFGYQFDAAIRFENYTKTHAFTTNLTKVEDSNIDLYIGALLLSSCHDENILKNATLIQKKNELFVCQDFRSKTWSMAMCLLLGLSGILTVVVIYWQFGHTLAFRDSVAYRQYQIRQLRLELRKRISLVSQFSTTESVEEKFMRLQYDQSADVEDEKAFTPYTLGDT